MKILILTGSPRSKGTTSLLADEFAKGAKEAGHEVVRFDTGILNIRPCIGCHHCQNNGQWIHLNFTTKLFAAI